MLKVGLTGNVASGKTSVADRWRESGVLVVDADRIGHAVLAGDAAVREALVEAFGEAILEPGGAIDRDALAERAFASAEAVARLDAIVHPPLLARLRAALDDAERAGRDLVAVDAALVYEFGFDRELDQVVLVTAPRPIRARRLADGRGLDAARIERIMAAQTPDADKAERADFVIVNDGSLESLRAEADRVLTDIRRNRRAEAAESAVQEGDA